MGAPALQAMGVDTDKGVLRLSFVHYTSKAELDRLLEALDACSNPDLRARKAARGRPRA
jgi:selenocysteine lyase/cysteine desulfurase